MSAEMTENQIQFSRAIKSGNDFDAPPNYRLMKCYFSSESVHAIADNVATWQRRNALNDSRSNQCESLVVAAHSVFRQRVDSSN